jgi:DNA-directed RNA polymerase specialized sigma24 family protein
MLPPPWRSPASFIAAIAQGDKTALRALYLFYAPLLRDQARQLGTPADERAELVTTVLDDFVLHVQSDAVVPYDVARYLVAAVRNRIRTRHRDRTRVRALHERAYSSATSGQRIVAESHSEFSLRSAQPSDDTGSTLATAVAKLAEWSALMLRPEELVLMIGVSRHVPLRDVAKQLGISYAAARVRVHRLRERFRTLVLQHVASLDPKEKREVERFLRRAGICLESRLERGRKE